MDDIINAASQLSSMPPRENDEAIGMVPYMHRGDAIPSALAAAMPRIPIRFPRRARNALWMESFAKTDTAEPITIPSTQYPKICSSWTVK